jgi:hypothetical protein
MVLTVRAWQDVMPDAKMPKMKTTDAELADDVAFMRSLE